MSLHTLLYDSLALKARERSQHKINGFVFPIWLDFMTKCVFKIGNKHFSTSDLFKLKKDVCNLEKPVEIFFVAKLFIIEKIH